MIPFNLKPFLFGIGLLLTSLILEGCSPSFQIVSLNDKFSDPNLPNGFLGKNNRLSKKSSKGGTHIDNKGVYLDPFVYKEKDSNKITSLGFYVLHLNFDISDGFEPIKEIIFINDKSERVVLNVEGQDSNYDVGDWNTISKEYNTSFTEKGICKLADEDFYRLAHANFLEAKIIGGNLTQTYDKADILDSFILNLRKFYDTQIK